MHIIPIATKLALVKHTKRYPADYVWNVHARIGGGGVTVTFEPDMVLGALRSNRPTTATYFVSIDEIRGHTKKWRI